MVKQRKRLGDLLVEAGLITTDQLEKALTVQKRTGERLGKVLINIGYITEESMIEVLEFQLGVPHIHLANFDVPREVATLIPLALAERYQAVPVKRQGKRITLAMVDPTNIFAIDDVRLASGLEIDPAIATEQDIKQVIHQSFGVHDLVEKSVQQMVQEEGPAATELETADDAPVINIVNSLISQAVKEHASDIHIEPQDEYVRVRYRIDGVLKEVIRFPVHTHAAIISRIKIMSEMDIAEKRIPQDGRIKVTEAKREIDLRVSTLPTIRGEKIVMRILDQAAVVLDVQKLGFSAENLVAYSHLYRQAYGMILVTGPTGSGKTTTLYSTLREINGVDKNLITVEDPVEYQLEGINQVQVNPKAGLTFANGLRSILRQDPNIIMIGEIRDRETAEIAIRAALTGHLVLSTLHTNDAAGAITRLIDMGVESFLVTACLLGVVAQRLVRCICPDCKTTYEVTADSAERQYLGSDWQPGLRLYHGTGCPRCSHTGYRGRIAIHEVMLLSKEVRQAISRGATSDELATIAKSQSMKSMHDDGLSKVRSGMTTVAEIMRVALNEN